MSEVPTVVASALIGEPVAPAMTVVSVAEVPLTEASDCRFHKCRNSIFSG